MVGTHPIPIFADLFYYIGGVFLFYFPILLLLGAAVNFFHFHFFKRVSVHCTRVVHYIIHVMCRTECVAE